MRYIFYDIISGVTRSLLPVQQLASKEHIFVEVTHRRPDRHKSWNLQIKFSHPPSFESQPTLCQSKRMFRTGGKKQSCPSSGHVGTRYSRRDVSGQLPPPHSGGKNPDGHWIESWVGPPAGLDVLGVTESEPAGIGIPDRPVRNLNAVPTTLSRLQ